jgi:hypothetical protein
MVFLFDNVDLPTHLKFFAAKSATTLGTPRPCLRWVTVTATFTDGPGKHRVRRRRI